MAETVDEMIAKLIGTRGRIVGDHPWAGHSGEIVRFAETIVGPGFVVRLDPDHDVPEGEECFVFHGRPSVDTRVDAGVDRGYVRRAHVDEHVGRDVDADVGSAQRSGDARRARREEDSGHQGQPSQSKLHALSVGGLGRR